MVAKNNHRRLITGLFRFARDEGWLRPNEETAAQRVGAYKIKPRDVEIFTPAEVARLLAAADEDFLPWVALIAFSGIRNEELHKGLSWDAISFDNGHVIVSAAISKTNRKRKIELPETCSLGLRRIAARRERFSNAIFASPWPECAKRRG